MQELVGALGLPGALAALVGATLGGIKIKQALNGGGPERKLGLQTLEALTKIELALVQQTAILSNQTRLLEDYMVEGRAAMKEIAVIKDRGA